MEGGLGVGGGGCWAGGLMAQDRNKPVVCCHGHTGPWWVGFLIIIKSKTATFRSQRHEKGENFVSTFFLFSTSKEPAAWIEVGGVAAIYFSVVKKNV